jgi:hypothetical protein
MRKSSAAKVNPIRQRDQFSCCAASLQMCLIANGVDPEIATLDHVSKVMNVQPRRGASFEDIMAAAQYYGQRATLIMPSTLRQVKEATDNGFPVVIGWNPEGRPWSHASVIFDVDSDLTVSVADPNCPDPEDTVRKIPKDEFYKKWIEESSHGYLIRRPALIIEPEITQDGRQIMASMKKTAEPADCWRDGLRGRDLAECYMGFPDDLGPDDIAHVKRYFPSFSGGQRSRPPKARMTKERKGQIAALDALLAKRPDRFAQSVRDQLVKGRSLSEKQLKVVRQILYKNRMRGEADLFRAASEEMQIMAKKKKHRKKKDPLKPKKDRNPVSQAMAEGYSSGDGVHKNRSNDVAKGRSRKPKHKNKFKQDQGMDREATAKKIAAIYLRSKFEL